MSDITITQSVEIDRPAADAWAVLSDYRRDVDWRAGVVAMAPDHDGPVRPGTVTTEDLRLAGRVWHNVGEVTAVDPGRRLAWRTTEGADARGARAVEPLTPTRCRVQLDLVATPHGPERLFRPLLARMLRKNLAGDVERLRALVESSASRAGRSAA